MIQAVSLIRLARACTPKVAKSLSKFSSFGKSVSEVGKMAQCAKGSEVGSFFSALSTAGEKLAGQDGFISFTIRESKKTSGANIVTAIFKKGDKVVAKIAKFVSPNKNIVGANIGGVSKIRYADVVENAANKVRKLAEELGVDIKTASARIEHAKFSGKNIKDEQVLKDVITGKFFDPKPIITKPKTTSLFNTVSPEREAHEAWLKYFNGKAGYLGNLESWGQSAAIRAARRAEAEAERYAERFAN